MLKIGKIQCKTIMGKSGIGPVDYAINPYLGCSHSCVYCYARFMSRMGHKGEVWGSFVDVKENAVERLKIEVVKKKKGLVLLSSVTDPYQPLEAKFKLTRGCLEVLLEYQYPVDILTKSSLVLRDLDLIKDFDSIEVGFTITSFDNDVSKIFEPETHPITDRLKAMNKLCDEGISTYAFMGPVLPYLTDENLDLLLDELASSVNRIMVDRLNIKSGNKSRTLRVLKENYPDLNSLFEKALNKDSKYFNMFKRKIIEGCDLRGIPCDVIY